MCNRYEANIERLRKIFPNAPLGWFEKIDLKYDSFYPRSIVPLIKSQDGSGLTYDNFQWGIFPPWAKKKSDIQTNSRSETILEKPTFRNSFLHRRCLLPATAFYEPVKGHRAQVKFEIEGEEYFCFAGIWDFSFIDGERIPTCSILTTEPNEVVGEVHPRMPVIIPREQCRPYLQAPANAAEKLLELLRPYPPDEMKGTLIE
jgi:putative SOS response-associated peptidase YedK